MEYSTAEMTAAAKPTTTDTRAPTISCDSTSEPDSFGWTLPMGLLL